MDPQFQELAREISETVERGLKEHIDQFEERADTRLKKHIDEFERRAETRMQMHFENLESVVKAAADGYGGTLEHIERELVDLNKKVDKKFGDHDLALANHADRITKLEERR